MKQSVSLKLGQSLTMTPALQQAIRMLQLSTLDLRTEIQEALESNLMLEAEEREEVPEEAPDRAEENRPAGDDIPENLPVDADWDDIYQSGPAPSAPSADEEALWDYRQANMHTPPGLHEHLTWQAELHSFTERDAEIAAHLIDAVDDYGYLRNWPELCARLCAEHGIDESAIETVLATVQQFDPPGVAARDLAECLSIQLRQTPPDTEGRDLALAIVDNDLLELLAAHDHAALARRLDVGTDALAPAVSLIQSLQPHPGEAFSDHEADYVVPEVFVIKREGRWQVTLNPDIAPRLRINPHYLALVKRADKSADQTTLKSHLQEARFFLNSLRSRNETLLRVAQCIVEAQRAFLEYGEEAMKPLVLRDVADSLDIHESTVSRATANKYMQTPRGLFELKYFFSSHVATTDGGTCSATAIQAMIRRLVGEEGVDKPLSDSKLAEMLLAEGVRVARRTVAKYREALGIPPSHQRRRQNA
ncbi:RNA polymerase factor sigma-54 [Salinisphaera sp. PC39]|uniref:RNA polymerase factor sigma-54 n=1 Tax=Salinisphaera sp. PC39 TaxID=1304156 RepID=UPI00333F0840